MKKERVKKLLFSLLLTGGFLIGAFVLSMKFSAPDTAQAGTKPLDLTATYEKQALVSFLEVTLSVDTSSDLTMLKYAYGRIAKGVYFTKYEKNGTVIEPNDDGVYSFSVTQNGYVSVFAQNEEGEEKLLVFEVTNVDTEKPSLTVESKAMKNQYYVSIDAKDDRSSVVNLQYVEGAYASLDDPIWEDAETFYNSHSLLLDEGKYTFAATDSAGNSHVIIRRFGEHSEAEEEFRAVWISYLEFKSTGYTEDAFRTQIETMFNEVCTMNMNAVVVHVRPFGDAMYESEYFPWSRFVSGKQGKNPGFDPLEIMVEEAHARGLEFHAWLNPYRVTSGTTDVTTLSKDNPARIYRTDSKKCINLWR